MAVDASATTTPPSSTWKVTVAYDGTDYRGWQVQPGLLTIQGELSAALQRITGETVLPQGSGRTDAGVHALAQVASFALQAPIPPASLVRALNHTLPQAIRILSAAPVPADFHARHSARGKTYDYRVIVCDPFNGQVCSPWVSRFAYVVERPLDLATLQAAAAAVIGEFDFTSFAASDPDRTTRLATAENRATTNIRTIHHSSWTIESSFSGEGLPPMLVYRVTGNGFLHHMVRNLVGTFLDVGWGLGKPDDLRVILAARDRSKAGRTAPARGLFLHHVEY